MKAISLLILFMCFSFLEAQNYNVPAGVKAQYNGVYYYEYNPQKHLSDWVGYTLKSHYPLGDTPEHVMFFEDSTINQAPKYDSFKDSGYELVQLFPQADARYSQKFMDKAHVLSNVVPMNYKAYQGVWRILDNMVRGWAMIFDSIHVISGPIYTAEKPLYLSKGKITIPDAFFKAVLVYNEIDMAAVGFVIPNKPLNRDSVDHYMYTIDSLEQKTGLTFFADLPDHVARFLKAKVDVKVFKEGSYSYALKSAYPENKRCVATNKSGDRCGIKTECISQNCWKHGCQKQIAND